MPDAPPTPRRPGWVLLTGISALIAVALVGMGLWALNATVQAQGRGAGYDVLLSAGTGLLFWGWITAGAWRRATEPDPDPNEPGPVPRRVAFVVANVVLALVFTAIIGGGMWVDVTDARGSARSERIEHRVEVAARAADLTVAGIHDLERQWQVWLAQRSSPSNGADAVDPVSALLPVEGAEVISVATTDDTGAILFRPDEGPPCVVLDIDADEILTTRQTDRCS